MGLESPLGLSNTEENNEEFDTADYQAKKDDGLKGKIKNFANAVMLGAALSGAPAVVQNVEASNDINDEQNTQVDSKNETREQVFDRLKTESANNLVRFLVDGDPNSRYKFGIGLLKDGYKQYLENKTLENANYCIKVMFDRTEFDYSTTSKEEYEKDVFSGMHNRITVDNYNLLIDSYKTKIMVLENLKKDLLSNAESFDSYINKINSWINFATYFRDKKINGK